MRDGKHSGALAGMVKKKSPPTTIHMARRIYHRNENEPLTRAMSRLGWQEAPTPAHASIVWDVETLGDTPHLAAAVDPSQLVNKVPGMLHCCRKAVFAQLLSRLQLLLPQSSSLLDGRYIPRQWALPAQADELSQHVASASKAAK